jgi:hypothetical protein
MATDELLDEREANALFELLEHRLPTAGTEHHDGEDAPPVTRLPLPQWRGGDA